MSRSRSGLGLRDPAEAPDDLPAVDVADDDPDQSKLPFVAPEVRLGESGEPGSDVYSAAALLFYAVTGTPPARERASSSSTCKRRRWTETPRSESGRCLMTFSGCWPASCGWARRRSGRPERASSGPAVIRGACTVLRGARPRARGEAASLYKWAPDTGLFTCVSMA